MAKKLEYSFAISAIVVEQFAILEKEYNRETPINIDVQYTCNVLDTNALKVMMHYGYLQNDKYLLLLEVACQFTLNDGFLKSFKHGKKFIIPKEIIHHFATITTGTTRGILHIKLQETDYHRFIMPSINILELIKEDVEINFKNKI